ncbi:hypothetical protein [Larkinella rosea]|uniref:Nuclear transport factor 2 family protein n=1 Tax=Larkinella rosea TaxID=2025312 RepID=A0A3P1C118_9BACT|nr:hypothetical protein [Larkinella rosea]RRB07110.1 hypothetical protein EHT25_04825 [Larkinella rosea]
MMKVQVLTLVVGLGLTTSVVAQQTASPKEDTLRRLRRNETRTTTTKLYPERDSILVILKNRMAVLNPGTGTAGSLTAWFTPEARIVDSKGSSQTPADYQSTSGKISYQNYRVRKLEINENVAESVEVYAIKPTETGGTLKLQSATSKLRKDPDGRWRITEMRISSK